MESQNWRTKYANLAIICIYQNPGWIFHIHHSSLGRNLWEDKKSNFQTNLNLVYLKHIFEALSIFLVWKIETFEISDFTNRTLRSKALAKYGPTFEVTDLGKNGTSTLIHPRVWVNLRYYSISRYTTQNWLKRSLNEVNLELIIQVNDVALVVDTPSRLMSYRNFARNCRFIDVTKTLAGTSQHFSDSQYFGSILLSLFEARSCSESWDPCSKESLGRNYEFQICSRKISTSSGNTNLERGREILRRE